MSYGFCPHCGEKVTSRERRLNGNDICLDGHKYPSKFTLSYRPNNPMGIKVDRVKTYKNALEQCVNAMDMQLKRESGEFHISSKTAKAIFDEAINQAKKLL